MTENETALATTITPTAPSTSVAENVRRYTAAARAPSTRRAYRRQWQAFVAWAEAHKFRPLPAAAETLAAYLAERADAGAKVSTLAQALSAITEAHKVAGYSSPRDQPLVRETWKGIKRRVSTAPRRARPVLVDHLRAIVAGLPNNLRGTRDRALLTLGFAAAMRRSELVALEVRDVEFTDDGLVVTIRRSKTDQDGAGATVGVPYGSRRETCPVRCVRAWLEAAKLTDGPLLRSVDRHGRIGGALDGRDVARILKGAVKAAGLDPAVFSGHSLRAGLATAAARAGCSDRAIMRQGRWSSRTMVDRYVRDAQLFAENPAAEVGL